MAELPVSPNFYSSLYGPISPWHVAKLYDALGWRVCRCTWTDYEVFGPFAELAIEDDDPVLMHGIVADVLTRAEELLAPLRTAGISFSAECYDQDGKLLREFHG